MNFSILKIFQIFGIASSWSSTALADGKVTLKEAASLAEQIATVLGVEIEIDVAGESEVTEKPQQEINITFEDDRFKDERVSKKPVED